MRTYQNLASRFGLSLALFIFTSDFAAADAIIPYMVVPWGQVFLLPLVIILEAFVLWYFLRGSFRSNLFQSFVANLASTTLGAISFVLFSIFFGDSVFEWWFKDGFSRESIRNALISLGFAMALCIISWASESIVIGMLRK